jgi:hypothetical protein
MQFISLYSDSHRLFLDFLFAVSLESCWFHFTHEKVQSINDLIWILIQEVKYFACRKVCWLRGLTLYKLKSKYMKFTQIISGRDVF